MLFFLNQAFWSFWYAFDKVIDKSKKHYYICDRAKAAGMYLALVLPNEKTPVESIKEIKAFGGNILANYTKPLRKSITQE